MRNEIADGQDTVGWLREQSWFDGRLATYGASYLGFRPVGAGHGPAARSWWRPWCTWPHDFSRTAYHNGVFGLYNSLGWGDLIAHQENTGVLQGLLRLVSAETALQPALDRMRSRPERATCSATTQSGSSVARAPAAQRPFWAPLQCGAPCSGPRSRPCLVGGWQICSSSSAWSSTGRWPPGECRPACSSAVDPPAGAGQGASRPARAWLARPLRRPGRSAAARRDPGSSMPRIRFASGSAARARSSGGTCPAGRRRIPAAAVVPRRARRAHLAEPAADAGARPAPLPL